MEKGDYSLEWLTEALKGQDAVVLTIGSAVIPEQQTVIDAAINAGVKRILPSEFGGVSYPFTSDIDSGIIPHTFDHRIPPTHLLWKPCHSSSKSLISKSTLRLPVPPIPKLLGRP